MCVCVCVCVGVCVCVWLCVFVCVCLCDEYLLHDISTLTSLWCSIYD